MTRTSTFLALAVFSLAAAGAAHAGDYSNSANYNGFGATTQNQASDYSMRDANGNLTMVNGQVTSATYGTTSGSQYANSYAGGVGTGGAGGTYGQAAAIGNQLNVTVVGSHNTTIIDSSQVNNGNQTATNNLNTH